MKKLKTKARVIAEIASKMDITHIEAARFYACMEDILKDTVMEQRSVSLFGLGMLHTVKRSAYIGRNPNTGEPWEMPERVNVKLNLSAPIKRALNA